MAFGKNNSGSILPFLIFSLAGLAGTAASLYAMVVAYLAGSQAQASIDGTAPADPVALARASMNNLASAVTAADQDDVINVAEDKVHVRNAQESLLESTDEEALHG